MRHRYKKEIEEARKANPHVPIVKYYEGSGHQSLEQLISNEIRLEMVYHPKRSNNFMTFKELAKATDTTVEKVKEAIGLDITHSYIIKGNEVHLNLGRH